MSAEPTTHEIRFARLAEKFAGEPDVLPPEASTGSAFGAGALKVNGSVFAMICYDQLVLKLPRARVTELIEAGVGGPFGGSATRRPMGQWLMLGPADDATWLAMARESLAFVRGGGAT